MLSILIISKIMHSNWVRNCSDSATYLLMIDIEESSRRDKQNAWIRNAGQKYFSEVHLQ